MRATVLGLALAFVAAQSVSWANCCCGTFCQRKNECGGCAPEDRCPGGKASTSSCCDEDDSKPPKTCSHQEPSSEIDSAPVDGLPTPPAMPVPLLLVELPVETAEAFHKPVDTGPPRAGPLDTLARPLSLRVLRI